MAKAVVDRHPDRFIYQPNLSPIKHRGLKNSIWELEYWVREKGARIFKFYPPEDTYINDPDLWPFYQKAEELGIVLDIHTGMSWVPPGKSKYSLPIQLDDVARDFPELKLVAFHMGYPHCDELNMVAMGHPNVYPCLSLLAGGVSCNPGNSRRYWEKPSGLRDPKRSFGERTRRLRFSGQVLRRRLQGFSNSRGYAGGVRLSGDHRRDEAQDIRRKPCQNLGHR